MSVQVVFLERIAHRDVGGRYVGLIDTNAPSSRRNRDYMVVPWRENVAVSLT